MASPSTTLSNFQEDLQGDEGMVGGIVDEDYDPSEEETEEEPWEEDEDDDDDDDWYESEEDDN